MRDEDLKALPKTIDRAKMRELMTSCGFGDIRAIKDFRVYYGGIEVTVYASGPDGSRDIRDYLTGPIAAEHTISIPFVGDWDPKDPDPRPDSMDLAPEDRERITAAVDAEHAAPKCGLRYRFDDSMVCTRAAGHAGAHLCRGETWA